MAYKVEGVKYKMDLTWGPESEMDLKSMVQILRKYGRIDVLGAQDTPCAIHLVASLLWRTHANGRSDMTQTVWAKK
jgi:hypothetical protein